MNTLEELREMARLSNDIVNHVLEALILSGESGVLFSPIHTVDNDLMRGFARRGIFCGIVKNSEPSLITADTEGTNGLKNIRAADIDDLLLMLTHTKFSRPEIFMQQLFHSIAQDTRSTPIEIIFANLSHRSGTSAIYISSAFSRKFRPEVICLEKIVYDESVTTDVIEFVRQFICETGIRRLTCSEYVMAARVLNHLLA